VCELRTQKSRTESSTLLQVQ